MEEQEIKQETDEILEEQLPPEEEGSSEKEEVVHVHIRVDKDFPNILKALLFATETPLSHKKIKENLGINIDADRIRKTIDEINDRFREQQEPFEIVEISGGFQFRTVQKYHAWIKKLFRDRAMRRLTQAGLETLAIVAYRQPISKSEIESIRGIQTDGAIKTLLEKGLITIAGRSEAPGRPLVYATTRGFLRYFGLNKLADMPKLEELTEIAGDAHLVEGFNREAETEITAPEEEKIEWQESGEGEESAETGAEEADSGETEVEEADSGETEVEEAVTEAAELHDDTEVMEEIIEPDPAPEQDAAPEDKKSDQ